MTPVVAVEGLSESYRRKSAHGSRERAERAQWALRDITFSVMAGEMLGVIGPNGSGKSTLLLCLGGILPPTEGSVRLNGRASLLIDLTAGLHRELTGRENIRISSVLNGLTRAEARDREQEIIAFSGLDEATLDSPLRTYSAGMGLRLGFAVTAHSDPTVLLVDEVLGVGDEEFQARCIDRVEELRSAGIAVVLVSHDLDLVAKRSSRVAVLDHGRLAFIGDPKDAVAAYVATSGPGPTRPPRATALFNRTDPGRRRRVRRAP